MYACIHAYIHPYIHVCVPRRAVFIGPLGLQSEPKLVAAYQGGRAEFVGRRLRIKLLSDFGQET